MTLLRLLGAWDPVLYVDLHVTDGAEFQHDVSNTFFYRRSSDWDERLNLYPVYRTAQVKH